MKERAYRLQTIGIQLALVLLLLGLCAVPGQALAQEWDNTGSMAAARSIHTATLLQNGKVLVVGGFGSGGFLSSAEIYLSKPKVPVDFDGDGKTDIAVYRPTDGVWYILLSSQGYDQGKYKAYKWGNSTDKPVVGDFDGDGKIDIAVFRPAEGVWYLLLSSDGYDQSLYKAYRWGVPTDIPIK